MTTLGWFQMVERDGKLLDQDHMAWSATPIDLVLTFYGRGLL